jgi:hypothetical protein
MLKTLAGAAMCALVAMPAHSLSVYDANGKVVGVLVGVDPELVENLNSQAELFPGLVVTQLQGPWHFLTVSEGGVTNTDPKVYYPTGNCTGQPYLPWDKGFELLPHAQYDGHTLWALATQAWGGYAVRSYSKLSACNQLPDDFVLVGAPAIMPKISFKGPFTIGK